MINYSILFNDRGTINFSPKFGYHYVIAHGNVPFKEVFVTDKTEVFLGFPWWPLIPIYERVYTFRFMFHSLMTEQEAIKKELHAIVTYEQDVDKKDESNNKVNTQKMCIVERVIEDQYYLLDNEIHPFFVDVIGEDSTGMRFIFNYSVRIIDMKKFLAKYPQGNGLLVAMRLIKYAMWTELVKMNLDQLRGVADKCLDDVIASVKNKLKNKFADGGIELEDILDEYFFPYKKTQEKFDAQVDKEINIINNITTINTAKANAETITINAEAEAKAIAIKGAAENTVLKNRETEVGGAAVANYGKKLRVKAGYQKKNKGYIDLTKVKIAKNMKNLKGTFVAGSTFLDREPGLNELEEVTILETAKKGGKDAA